MDIKTLKNKKVVLVTHNDTLGGAAIVTFRLMQALRREGVEARMVVYTKLSEEENVSYTGTRFERGIRFCLERLQLLPHLASAARTCSWSRPATLP